MSELIKRYHVFVGTSRYETDKSSLTGAGIKALAGVTPTYELFYRDDVNSPDRQIRDTEAVQLILDEEGDETPVLATSETEAVEGNDTKSHSHFYAVPNSSYKRLKSNP